MSVCVFSLVMSLVKHTIIYCIKKVLITKYIVIATFLCEECVFHS